MHKSDSIHAANDSTASNDHTIHTRQDQKSVLFVDLNQTLLKTSLLNEGLLLAIRIRLLFAVRVIFSLLRDRASGKQMLAEKVAPDYSRLPFRHEVIRELVSLKEQGTKLVLATATDRRWATGVASELGLFDDVIASDGNTNLSGSRKLAAIEEFCSRDGFAKFDYLGNSRADLPVFEHATKAYTVGPGKWLSSSTSTPIQSIQLVDTAADRTASILKLIRPLQWVKNLLIFAPILLAHEFGNIEKWQSAILAFILFSLCASAVYVINDLFDIESDRHHPRKIRRPFASGALPVTWGPPIVLVLLVVALFLAVFLPFAFFGVLTAYLILTSTYSMWLKRIAIVDVLVLSSLYAIRIIAGSAATEVPISEWLMAFSLFFFLSLAFAKRYAELRRLADEEARDVKGRGYEVADWSLIESIGPTSGYLAVLVFALYIHSEEMYQLYANGWALWLVCPLLLYWITRIWLKANRQQLTEDPIVFAVKDRVSWLVGALIMVLALISRSV